MRTTWFFPVLFWLIVGPAVALADSIPATPSVVPPIPAPCYTATDGSSGCGGPPSHQTALNAQVVFDGQGEAAVALDLNLDGADKALSQLTLVIPGATVRIRRVLQQYTVSRQEDYCQEYGLYDTNLKTYPCTVTGKRTVTDTKVDRIEPRTRATAAGLEVTVPFVHPVAVNESTSLALAYKATGYASDRLGLWTFAYPTPTVPLDLDTVRVRVDVAGDLTLQGGQSTTQYASSLAEGIATSALTAFPSGFAPQFKQAVQDTAAFVKETSALDPNSSFTVHGRYATSWLRLYWLAVLLIGIGMAVFVGIIIWGERRAARINKTHP